MQKKIIIILSLIVFCCGCVSCSVNSSSGDRSTTAVTDTEGLTHFYESVTDENGEIVTVQNGEKVFAEIETDQNATAVTNSKGAFVTMNETTVFSNQNTASNVSSYASSSGSSDDNAVTFEPETDKPASTERSTQNTTATEPATVPADDTTTTQSATDADGWINKWY